MLRFFFGEYITIVFRISVNNLFCFYCNAILLYHDLDGKDLKLRQNKNQNGKNII